MGTDDAIENNHLSEVIVGVNSVKSLEEYIAYTEKSKIKDIFLVLEDFDIDKG